MGFTGSIFGALLATTAVLALGAVAEPARGQCRANELAKLVADDGTTYDNFGYAVAVSGDTILIGARGDDENGSNSGSAYVFRANGASWVQEAKLLPSDGAAEDYFGWSVAASAGPPPRALVGARFDDDRGQDSGSAYVFRYDGAAWVQEAKLVASDGEPGDWFGYSVAIAGDTAVVGAKLDNDNGTNSGSAYVFRYDGSQWVQQAKLLPADGAAHDWFGFFVAVSADAAVIGSVWDDDNGADSGSAYVFRYDGLQWDQESKLLPSDGAADDWFGYSLALSGDAVLVAAVADDDNGSASGSAYVFRYDGSSWAQEAKLLASDGAVQDYFGRSVAVSGDIAVIGAREDDDNGSASGSAYVFCYDGSGWGTQEQAKLLASDGAALDFFGVSVGVSGDTAVIGAYEDDDSGDASGAAYVFRGLSDCNTTGAPDLCDIASGLSQDCNMNQHPDECDVTDGGSEDLNLNAVPDECEDCDEDGLPDECDVDCAAADGNCDVVGCGLSPDCNTNGLPDSCEPDTDGDGLIDGCDPDIDGDGVANLSDACPATPAPGGVDAQGRPLGELDGDCDVDLDDFSRFAACYHGASRPAAAGCPLGVDADLDGDGDVDLDDFSIFAANYTGSL